ncbi:unnamed protein product [Brachionus calyciflorus]|uniref:GH18 domain-containing protein n=1 Tax=Brachionus calyciflorus TaxID=104777 RepID=A0A813MAR8_9BILA|nr:unnamed protein product [Brachionus calyciflorus]
MKSDNMRHALLGFISIYLFLISLVKIVKLEESIPKIEILKPDADIDDENFQVDLNDANLPANPKKNLLVPPYAIHEPEYKRVCIYPNWSILRDSNMAKIFPEDIPPDLCTHIHYAYANIDVRSLQLTPSQFQDTNNGDHGAPIYERIIKLRESNPNLKILISIGGWFAKSTPFNQILQSDATRTQFIQNALNFLKTWNFDGLDIQWEYPGDIEFGASPDSRQKFTTLIKYLYKAFKDEYKSSFKKYILTAFAPADESRIDAGYQVRAVCKYLDYLSIATYDYTGPYDTKTGYNSPLYSRSQTSNSVNSSVNFWLERGCPSKKILLGIPTYARAFKIIKRTNTNLLFVGIESEPFVSPSIYTSEEGILSYYEVCELLTKKESRVYWDDIAEVPFAIVSNPVETGTESSSSNLWISYEDARSSRKKVEYAKKMSLGGVSVWSLDMDDFKDMFCNLGPFPILESVKEEFEHKITQITDEIYDDTTPILSTDIISTKNLNRKLNDNGDDVNGYDLISTRVPGEDYDNFKMNSKMPQNILAEKSNDSLIIKIQENYEQFKNKLKKFKAIREIRLISCLDKQKCSVNNSIKNYRILKTDFIWFFLIKFLLLKIFKINNL